METPTAADAGAAPLSRGERLARDVMHSLKIDSQPWKEIQANRPDVIRATFKDFDCASEFEGMLAAQLAITHSIFLGSSWLSLDRERPERDRTYYLRMAGRMMMLYRQHFSLLRQCRKDREKVGQALPRPQAPAVAAPQPREAAPLPSAIFKTPAAAATPGGQATLSPLAAAISQPATAVVPEISRSVPPPAEVRLPDGPLPFPRAAENRSHRLMQSASLAWAQGP